MNRDRGVGDSTEKGYGEVLVPVPLTGGPRKQPRKIQVPHGAHEDMVLNPKSRNGNPMYACVSNEERRFYPLVRASLERKQETLRERKLSTTQNRIGRKIVVRKKLGQSADKYVARQHWKSEGDEREE